VRRQRLSCHNAHLKLLVPTNLHRYLLPPRLLARTFRPSMVIAVSAAAVAHAEDSPVVLDRNGSTIEYGALLPVFRAHGSRKYNEVWSYGKQAEPILEKYLRLRYQFLPYIYSLGRRTYQSGAPYMRALLDFPNDPKVADLGDEYMLGPAFVVAPVTEQGVTSRAVYLGKRRLVQLLD
jgi:hypothetical protein